MIHVLLVGTGAFLGGVARYSLSGWIHHSLKSTLPWGTLAVNVLGCLGIGAALYYIEDRAVMSENARLFWTTGILGGFTTFSAFGYETLGLMRNGAVGAAMGNILVNVILGIAAVWLGHALLKAISA